MFGPLYDDKHRFFGISSNPKKPNRTYQKGLREKLLCVKCEQQLSRYEGYARDVFFGETLSRPARSRVGFVFSGVLYKPLKLFLMSLLWRFSITKLEHYRGIDLGPHQESLRELISQDDPGDWLLFPCMITGLLFERKHIANFVIPPMRTRFEAQRVWVFAIAGFLFHFFVSNRLPPDRIRGAFLQHDGTFHVPVADIGEIPSVQFWMKQMAAAEKTRSGNRTTY